MNPKLLLPLLCALCLSVNAVAATTSRRSCNWRLTLDFEGIQTLMPLTKGKLSSYNKYKTDINAAMRECPKEDFHILLPGMPALNYLHFAILAQNDKIVAELIRNWHHISSSGPRGTLLHFAAYYGNVKILRILLRAGLPIDSTDSLGYTPLMVASGGVEQNGENVKFLVEHGADIWHTTKQGNTPLSAAIVSEDVPAVKYLLAQGALKKQTPGALSPEEIARKIGNQLILNLLQKYGGDAK